MALEGANVLAASPGDSYSAANPKKEVADGAAGLAQVDAKG
jgi:hypothetical protein